MSCFRWRRPLVWSPALLALSGCATRTEVATPAPAQPDRIAIVAAERGPRGARLVAIDEHGDRSFELLVPVRAAEGVVRDTNPAISPDGRWMVFASTRGRGDRTSLWIAPLGVEAQPVQLTFGDAIDSHPAWTPDGRAIVFASTRDGPDFDLWQLAIEGGRGAGDPIQLTDAPSHEVAPAVARDGTIVYAAVVPQDDRAESRLEERAPDGTVRALTEGPADTSPALSPDGATLVFARPALHDGAPHSELWQVARGGEAAPVRLVELPLTDESGPVWSRDGRFVFATSLLRGADGKPLFSSVVHVDLQESPRRARMLQDRAGAVARLTPAIATSALDVEALRRDPEYLPQLAKIMADAIAHARQEP